MDQSAINALYFNSPMIVCPTPLYRSDTPQSLSSGLHPEPQDSDEAMALRLQQELDRETAGVQTVDLEDGGLFFCQICQRDLSHMTPEGRTQHLNRSGYSYLYHSSLALI